MLDGVTEASGGVDGNAMQVGKQFAEITAISAYSFTVSCALLLIMKYIPGLSLRVTEEEERQGLDFGHFIDETIGDWNMFDHMLEIDALRTAIVEGHSITPPAQTVASSGETKRD